MKISKAKDTYDDYKIEQVSFKQLEAIKDALAKSSGADADELRANIEWSLERLPSPGQEEDDLKKDAESEKSEELPEPTAKASEAPRAMPGQDAGMGMDTADNTEFPDLGLPDLPDPDEMPSRPSAE